MQLGKRPSRVKGKRHLEISPLKIDNSRGESFYDGKSVKYRKMVLQGSIPCQ